MKSNASLKNPIFDKNKKYVVQTFTSLLCLAMFLPFQNCGTQLEFAQQSMSLDYALVYDGSESDQLLLSQKVQGYERPSLNAIFNQWSRVSGPFMYQKASDIIPEPQYAFCFSSLSENGVWAPAVNPANGNTIANPGSDNQCINSASFGAASWVYMPASNSLRCATNAGNYVGFISGVPFDNYENEAVLTSENKDDDSIGLIIASVKDSSGNIHVLSATRSHGGNGADLGWGIVYYVNGQRFHVASNVSVGGVFKNNALNGWSDRKSLVKVIRAGDHIEAYASDWYMGTENLAVNPVSKVELNLADPIHAGMFDIFRGPQKYGYGTQSQLGATFQSIKFKSFVDAKIIFDLKNNRVYRLIEDGSGRFEQVSGQSVYSHIGGNKHVINPETQKAFYIWSEGRYKQVEGDDLDKTDRVFSN